MKKNLLTVREVTIEYKNDKTSRNKLIKLLIDYLIEISDKCGDNHEEK